MIDFSEPFFFKAVLFRYIRVLNFLILWTLHSNRLVHKFKFPQNLLINYLFVGFKCTFEGLSLIFKSSFELCTIQLSTKIHLISKERLSMFISLVLLSQVCILTQEGSEKLILVLICYGLDFSLSSKIA